MSDLASPPVLVVNDLMARLKTGQGVVHAVNGVSFEVNEGETLAIVGESGSGKSVTVLSLLRLIPTPPSYASGGQAEFLGRDLLQMSVNEIRTVRGGRIGMVFQDPLTSLNPVLTIGRQLSEPFEVHMGLTRAQARARALDLLKMVGIPAAETRLDDYPHQFSGGMRQRVMIAMALACSPTVLIADEPTTALDVTIQAQIIELVTRLRDELDMAIIWITHDLGIVAGLAHRVLVMYAGFIVEQAPVEDLFARPQHPYTRGLLGSLPRIDSDDSQRLTSIEGLPPDLLSPPSGCPFAPRCPHVFARCVDNPRLMPVRADHAVACWWDVEQGAPRA